MANLTYCAMHNTQIDMSDCVELLEERGISGLSESEKKEAKKLYQRCKEFIELYENEMDEE